MVRGVVNHKTKDWQSTRAPPLLAAGQAVGNQPVHLVFGGLAKLLAVTPYIREIRADKHIRE